MKKTTKLIASLLAVVMLAVLLCACTGAKSPAGVYKIKTIDGKSAEDYYTYTAEAADSGISLDDYKDMLEQLGFTGGLDEFITIELKDDGTGTIKVALEDDEPCTWELSGKTLTITADGEDYEMEYNNGTLTADFGDVVYVFGR